MSTIADRVAQQFDNDGSLFEVNGFNLDDACMQAGAALEIDGDVWRYEFSDGSALTGGVGGWDIESPLEKFVMRG